MRISGRVLAGAALIVLGVLWLLQTTDVVDIDGELVAPIALMVIGVLLAVSAARGLHVPLFVAGIVLTVILAGNDVASPARFETEAHVDQTETPTAESDLRPYRIGAGDLTIDLTQLPLAPEKTYRVSARVGAGRLEVWVPAGVGVHITARTGAGNVNIFGRRSSGVSTNMTQTIDYPERTRFEISLRAGVGSIVVRHRPRPEANPF